MNEKYLYAMQNKQTGEIITSPTTKQLYYSRLKNLYNAYLSCVINKHRLKCSIDDIVFKKFELTECELSKKDVSYINNITENYIRDSFPKNLKHVIKYPKYKIDVRLPKSEKGLIECFIQRRKNEERGTLEYGLTNWTTGEIYYLANDIMQLRELIYRENKKGNIEIKEAGLYLED